MGAINALIKKGYVREAWLASENDPDQKPGAGPTSKYTVDHNGRKYLDTVDRCLREGIREPERIEAFLRPGL